MTNHITFYQFCSAVQRKGPLALGLALCMLGLGLSASAQKPTIITFDVVGAGTEAGQGTFAFAISPTGAATGAVTGWYVDAGWVWHGFLRAPDGSITTFDAPGAGTVSPEGTVAYAIDPEGAITGFYQDTLEVNHGFLRAPDGKFTTFDAPGAGTGAGTGNYVGSEGTFGDSNNPAGWILGSYEDAYYVSHGFLRAPDGTVTEFNARGAGPGPGQGTFVDSVSGLNPAGAAAGEYLDEGGVNHGYVRTPDGTITEFDAPGAGTETGQGTSPDNLNPEGAVAGCYWGASGVYHSFVRAPDGAITTFDVPGAGTSSGQGTIAVSNNLAGAITGYYITADGVYHGFLRTP